MAWFALVLCVLAAYGLLKGDIRRLLNTDLALKACYHAHKSAKIVSAGGSHVATRFHHTFWRRGSQPIFSRL